MVLRVEQLVECLCEQAHRFLAVTGWLRGRSSSYLGP
jgi:hypothetical protein